MGIFDFVTSAGTKLGGAVLDMLKGDEDVDKPETISKERMDELRKANIEKTIADAGIEVNGLDVKVNGSDVTLGGAVNTQEELEKAAIAAGNQHGIGKVDAQVSVANPEPEATMYTVVSGDTLSKIAQQHLGSAGQYMKIFEANKPLLSDPNKIYPGQVLRIPK